jgi:hypothetical protein
MSRSRIAGLLAGAIAGASLLLGAAVPAAAVDIPGTRSRVTGSFCEGGPSGHGIGSIAIIAKAAVLHLEAADTVTVRFTMQTRIDGTWVDGATQRFSKDRPGPGAWRFTKPWHADFHPADVEYQNRIEVTFRYIDHRPGSDGVLSQVRHGDICLPHSPHA